ncbi:hypothetical protein OO010_12515 [Flavobacteriaceae bacterium KMM 6898]|nr:hypothetical protein [Flavobacteriaceae bacterium KMM 6898]
MLGQKKGGVQSPLNYSNVGFHGQRKNKSKILDLSPSIVYHKKGLNFNTLTSLDNLKGTTSTDYISSLDESKFKNVEERKRTNDREGFVTRKLMLDEKPIGLNYLSINLNNNKIHYEINARILKENYKYGICINTIDQLLKVLLDCGIGLHHDFMKDTNLSMAHEKNDLLVDFDSLQTELAHITANGYFRTVMDNSVSFKSSLKTYNQITTFYNKFIEILRHPKKYKDLGVDINDFQRIARMETKSNNYQTVKRNYKTRNMEYILNNNGINYNVIMELLNNQPMEIKEMDLANKSLTEINNIGGMKLIFDHCQGDINLMKKVIKNTLGENTKPTAQYKKLYEIYPILKNPQGRTFECLEVVKNDLRPR